MSKIRYVASEESLDFAQSVAKRLGIDFDRESAHADAPGLLSAYLEEMRTVLGAGPDDFVFEDYSERTLDAVAFPGPHGRRHIHLDQHLDFWMFSICLLWSIAALNGIPDCKTDAFDQLFLTALDQDDGGVEHETLRDRVAPWLEDAGEALMVAHNLSIACFIALAGHEIAHHRLAHFNRNAGPEIEIEADVEGYELLKRVYRDPDKLDLIPFQPYALAAPWVVLQIFNAAERRSAQRSSANARFRSRSHPLATERIAALQHLLQAEEATSPALAEFRHAYEIALSGIFAGTGLAQIG